MRLVQGLGKKIKGAARINYRLIAREKVICRLERSGKNWEILEHNYISSDIMLFPKQIFLYFYYDSKNSPKSKTVPTLKTKNLI